MARVVTPPAAAPHLLWLVGDRLLTEERWRSLVGHDEVIRLDGKKLDVAVLSREIDTLPMFVQHRWILVQDFRAPGKKANDDSGAKSDTDADKGLLAALGRINEKVTVILVSELGDRRTRLYRLVQEKGQYIELAGFKEYDTGKMAEWVVERLGALGKRISPPLATELVLAVGPDLSQLASEVEKLAIAMGEDNAVADRHMDVIAGSPVVLRRLIDEGILRKQPARAQALLDQTLAGNEHPLRILNFLIPRIRDLLRARLCPEGRRNPERAAALFSNLHPFRIRSLYEEADRFQLGELREAIHSLVLADTCLKSSVDGRHVMSLLIAALTGATDHPSFARAMQNYVEPWD